MNTNNAQRVMEAAYDEWRAGTSEKDMSPDGRLAGIFRDSGWGGFTFKASGALSDWCGFFAGCSLYRAGMHPDHRSAFYHAMNVEDFATYGAPRLRNPRRLKREVLVDGVWMPVKAWHEREGKLRQWIPESALRHGDPASLDIRPADVVLIDYQGVYDAQDDERGDEADHITLAAELTAAGVLEVMNGNASGLSVIGAKVGDAVSRTLHDLNTSARKRLYGICRLSDLDFDRSVTYR